MNHIKSSLIVFLFLCIQISVQAQDEKIKEIREHYNTVGKLIQECDKDEPENCTIYRNDLLINTNGERTINWPATGKHYKKITFWYDRPPVHWIDETGEDALLKIILKSAYSVHEYYYEYLFKDGLLVFCFVKKDEGEYRYYFENEKLFKFIEKNESNHTEFNEEDNTKLLEEATKLQTFFLNMFQ